MTTKNIVEKILSQPIESLIRTKSTQTRKEALRLYREIFKFSAQLDWKNNDGQLWRDILRKSARREFDIGKHEQDPIIAMKMILTSREAIIKTKEKMGEAFSNMNNHYYNSRVDVNNNYKENLDKYLRESN